MRVVAGSVRGFQLVVPSGKKTRPTSNRIKETLFNILQWDIAGSCFLDLFSGSGGIAIEALSRGAKEAVLVEQDREAVRCIKENIKHTRMEDSSRVMAMDVMQALRRLEQSGQVFDIIFMDPPYHKNLEEKIISYLLRSSLVKQESLIIVETALDTDVTYMQDFDCTVERIKEYKSNRHVFLRVEK
ncbi:MAG: 16S rRNA (guanine(966)-N(2))-methyltransferase RsmD [Lachnospiraceae bacterium]|nr:16S rRNA (guanine(966)-N(2))-methyltransferase RsmD [Lachnospiraceae bacterium]